jgi:biotin synthase
MSENADTNLAAITESVISGAGKGISIEQALYLSGLEGDNVFTLVACAAKVRQRFKAGKVFTCAITNAKSGRCSQDCAFCAQSAHHRTNAKIYPLLETQQLVDSALAAREEGATNFSMVTSGHMLSLEEMDRICRTAAEIQGKTDLTVCASLGELDRDMAIQLKQSGVTNYHHNLETAQSFFPQICTTHEYEEDIQTIRTAAAAGLRVCSGGILGLGESWAQRIELSETLRKLDVDSIPLNFLNPIPGTRLANQPVVKPLDALKAIAIFRMMNPATDITICGGREITLKDMQSWVFMAGANGLMIGNYLTTQGRSAAMDREMIADMGLSIL